MTEAEWNACGDPQPILEFVAGEASDRKLRLFAVACCRRIWHLFSDSRERKVVETVERFVDGHESSESVWSAWRGRLRTVPDQDEGSANDHYVSRLAAEILNEIGSVAGNFRVAEVARIACSAVAASARDQARAAGLVTSRVVPNPPQFLANRALSSGEAAKEVEERAQVTLLRDIFGNRFHPVTIDPSWLAWNNGTVPALAQSIYDVRAFDRMPILADALEDAGCHDTDILGHCRGLGTHVRGCWVVDLLLGKG